MAIVLPAFTTSAVITSATLIPQTGEQLNILMNDVKNYVQDNYNVILSSLSSDIEIATDTIDEKLSLKADITSIYTQAQINSLLSAINLRLEALENVYNSGNYIVYNV